MKQKAHVLIVEDEAILYNRMHKVLQKEFYTVDEYTPSVKEAIARINNKRPDIVLLDINLQGKETGIDLGKQLYQTYQIPFIYVTDYDDDQTFYQGLETHHENFIVKTKPRLNPKEIIRAIQTALNKDKKNKLNKKGVLGLVDYLDNIKKYSKNTITRVPVKFDNIAFFTNKPFVNENNEKETLRPNYMWFLTKNNEYFFLKKSLKELSCELPYHFVRINENYIVNISPEMLTGRINGNKLLVMNKELIVKETYMNEFKKRFATFYQS